MIIRDERQMINNYTVILIVHNFRIFLDKVFEIIIMSLIFLTQIKVYKLMI